MLCENCKNNKVCKYRDEVLKEVEHINNINTNLPLIIYKNCKLWRTSESEEDNNA